MWSVDKGCVVLIFEMILNHTEHNSKTVKNDYFLKNNSQLFQIFSDFKSVYTIAFLLIGAV
jgi:hypothetical protein